MKAFTRIPALAALMVAFGAMAAPPPAQVQIRFFDSATGYALQPEVSARARRTDAGEKHFAATHIGANGRASFALEQGSHTVTAASPRHYSISGPLQVCENNPNRIEFLLDPLELPHELQTEDIIARLREGVTLVQGFIVDEDSGQPLARVRVNSIPSGAQTESDERGFYQLYIPVQNEAEQAASPASLSFEKPGFSSQDRLFLELWSRGDWTYNIRLSRGGGRKTVDERRERRQELREKEIVSSNPAPVQPLDLSLIEPSAPDSVDVSKGKAISTDTIRLPRNIRVDENGVLYYVTMNFYEKHCLPHEWIASWSSNSLNAGALAVRGYAIARINGRSPTSASDICGDSNCQNFKPTSSSSSTDKAVDYTAGYVLVNGSGNISSTEYSAENNSLDKDCGDGFTAPTSGCLYDPICAGHARSGHGRGMCQRGSNRWDTSGNGFPVRDWKWILKHYYPALTLVHGAPLVVGDNVESSSSDCDVRACAGGSITNGILCTWLTNKVPGKTGVIIGGPLVITNDTKGFTWYQVRWNDAGSTTGWSCENYLERTFSAPTAPTGLVATASTTNRITLSWADTANVEDGSSIERAPSSGGPWLEIATVDPNVTFFTNRNLQAGNTWFYRVRAYNAAGDSAYTATASATTPDSIPPSLAPIPSRIVTPGTLVTFTNVASAPERIQSLTDFEAFISETANGVVLFRTPNFSGTTSNFLDHAPEMDIAAVTDTYPNTGHETGNVLYVHCNFTNASNPWLRLTTASTATFPNPVIDFTKKLRFDVYSDKPIKVAAGCRETTTPAGTVLGTDGGTSGASIEWVGVTNVSGTAPMATRIVTSNTWTTLTFDFPNEPIRSFSGGNGILSTASGLGVLEHLAIVPNVGTGVYNFYLDNFAVLVPRALTYSLGAGAPTNATLNATNGIFAWTPTPAQSPSSNLISVIVTDNSSPPLRATNTFTVLVNNTVTNSPPLISPIANRTVTAGSAVTFTNFAYDPNPADALTFSLDPGAPATASVGPTTGVFTWTTTNADTNSVHSITVRATDNGSPPLSATAVFSVTVLPPPPPNHSPLLFPVANRTVNVGSTLTFTNLAFDQDSQDILTFSLDPGAPAAATIGPADGILFWIPADADSNAVHYITIRVSDNGTPVLSASATFSVTVLPRPPNQAPTLAPIADRTVHAGTTVTVTNSATDPDSGDALSFDLGTGAPPAATIDVLTGIFTWTTSDADANTTNHITVTVTDDGDPPMSAAMNFAVEVRPKPLLQIMSASSTGVALRWSAIPSVIYHVMYKTNLTEPAWVQVGPNITATNSTATYSDNASGLGQERFYRVAVMN